MFRLLSKIPKLVNLWRGVILRRLILISGGKCGARLTVEKGLRIRQGFHSRWELGTDVYVGRNTTIDCLPGALLRIGNNVSVTEGLFVSVCERVEVGANCLIGEYCSISDANRDINDANLPFVDQPLLPRLVIMADNIWIGRRFAILAGAMVGAGSVVGANSFAIRQLSTEGIYARSPARLIQNRRRI